ncbi:hypothetical protein ACOTH0_08745 [Achromobacter xylosoxidans]
MKYFKSNLGDVFAFESDGSQDELIDSSLVEVSEAEALALAGTPEPAPIISITRRQGRLALLDVGRLDSVERAIAAIEDATERRSAEIEYEADTWERGNEFLQSMWQQMGGTPSELDDLFILAKTK